MSNCKVPCLYCTTENEDTAKTCSNCGMELPDSHPHSGDYRRKRFKWGFWFTVIFCLVMMAYLPR